MSELDDKIQKAEIKLSEEKLRERRWAIMWVIYSSIIWVVYTLYCFVELRKSSRDFESIVLLAAPVVACPVGYVYIFFLFVILVRVKDSQKHKNICLVFITYDKPYGGYSSS